MHSVYENSEVVAEVIRDGRHREFIGGMWEELGILQFNFLKSKGLRPSDRLLDIGAGALRLGVLAIPYLDIGCYYATDRNIELLKAGWCRELDEAGRARLPLANLSGDPDFDFSFLPVEIDFAIAQSVFTHLPIASLSRCLKALAPHMRPGGTLFVTAFLTPPGHSFTAALQHRGGVTSFPDRDPFHHAAETLIDAARDAWIVRILGDWNHPRGQSMVEYRRP